MDTSETFIKQCEKAEEIQEAWKPQYGDYIGGQWFIDTEDNIGLTQLGIVLSYDADKKLLNTGGAILWSKETNFWLPRQDQLQAMVDWKDYDISIDWHSLPCKFYWAKDPLETQGVDGGSMEQLWLAFVMQERYSKIWNGEEWIKS